MTKEEIKNRIAKIEEFNATAGYRICGIDVKVRNLKVLKTEVIADIIVKEESGLAYRYNEMKYPLNLLNFS